MNITVEGNSPQSLRCATTRNLDRTLNVNGANHRVIPLRKVATLEMSMQAR